MKKVRWQLRELILILIMGVTLTTLLVSFYASYRVQKQTLIENALEVNHVYTVKMASNTNIFLQATLQRLVYNAERIGKQFNDLAFMQSEVESLLYETNSFNSVAVINKDGIILTVAPNNLGFVGTKLNTEGAQQALQQRQPYISSPYMSAANNLIILLAVPIFTAGEYQGYVGAAVYLHNDNILHSHLEEHYHKDGSYIYVVDNRRRLLYHPDRSRLGTVVGENALLDNARAEQNGRRMVINSQGTKMLAGFATIPIADWVVVSQRPYANTIEPLRGLLLTVAASSVPLVVIIFIIAWWVAKVLTTPIERLALFANRMQQKDSIRYIRGVAPRYMEAEELKRAMLVGLTLLHENLSRLSLDAETDPLTGLNNRRTLAPLLEQFTKQQRLFSAIAIDADHFKKVNDQYGHEVGDAVLKGLASIMRSVSRDSDLLFRMGGEEFLMLLPNTRQDIAVAVAERLREKVATTAVADVSFTISLGVAQFVPDKQTSHGSNQVLMDADQMLYEAKRAGRNCVKVFPQTDIS